MKSQLDIKMDKLKEYLKELGSVAVAFSGGVDSAFLLQVAHDTLGDQAIAVTASACYYPERELKEAAGFCRERGIRQIVITSDEIENESFCSNPKDRCYYCKTSLLGKVRKAADENGIAHIAEGSNMDDEGDYRPGHRAIAEIGAKSPLRFAGLTKQEIRILSKELGLPTWEKPSYACLASRFPYGDRITKGKVSMVEQAEQFLVELGFKQMRVRIHGQLARIEVLPEDFGRIMEEETRKQITEKLLGCGFTYVTLDLKGFRSGSMNEVLTRNESNNAH